MKKFMFLAAIAVSAPALAQSNDALPFDGPFAGVQAGWQQDRQRLELTNGAGLVGVDRNDHSGLSYGGQVGFDFNLRNGVVIGVEGSMTGRTGTEHNIDQFGNPYDFRLGRTFNATGRVGVTVGPDGLVYARGGYSNARFILVDNFGKLQTDRGGWTVGLGYEQSIVRNVSARVEYNYSQYGHDDLGQYATDYGLASARVNYKRHNVSAGLNFRF